MHTLSMGAERVQETSIFPVRYEKSCFPIIFIRNDKVHR